jgi:signal transduction histidine kinase
MDEDAETLEKVQGGLRREGFRVLVAADGEAGLRLAQRERPDLIILDLLLGGVDGIQVCHELREHPDTRAIPILLHTALSIPERGPDGRFALTPEQPIISVDAYMPKPTDLRRMLELVWALVEPDRPFSYQAGEVVLLIDGDDEQRAQIATALDHHGYHVIPAHDVGSGLRLSQTIQPDLIVFDDKLPGSRSIPSHARRMYRDPALIVIVGQETDIAAALLEDVDDYLLQPIQPGQAVLSVKSAMDRLRAQRLNRELTNQLRQSNRRLLETKQALHGQNRELQISNERLRLLHTARQTFVSMVVHDLRTPLSAMMSTLALLQGEPGHKADERQQETMNGALAAGQRMVRLIDTLLDLQALEAGHLPLTLEPMDANGLIISSLEELRPMFEVHEIRVESELSNPLPILWVDGMVTHRVLVNLLDNAIKFTPPGGIIHLSSHQEGEQVVFSIQDSGPGIPEDQKKVMVDRFGQPAVAPVLVQPGFGLGLAFCKLAADAMHGRIWVDSDLGHGSTFHVAFPAAREP